MDWQSAMVDCDFDCPLIAAAAIGNRCTFSALIGAKLSSNQLAALEDNLQYLDSLNGLVNLKAATVCKTSLEGVPMQL